MQEKSPTRRIIVGISGASGIVYGIKTLTVLKELGYETHLILTEAAKRNMQIETEHRVEDVERIATKSYDEHDLAASLASGSFLTMGMIVAPCTIKSLSSIANSYSSDLLTRAADVCLKERRKLVLVVRETPLHKGHLKLMSDATDIGALILPPVPAFYHRPKTIDDIVSQTVGKVLDYFQIEHALFRRWESYP
jgi:4-hydroxy-3-polyprenylbenzoate decarboxylase